MHYTKHFIRALYLFYAHFVNKHESMYLGYAPFEAFCLGTILLPRWTTYDREPTTEVCLVSVSVRLAKSRIHTAISATNHELYLLPDWMTHTHDQLVLNKIALLYALATIRANLPLYALQSASIH